MTFGYETPHPGKICRTAAIDDRQVRMGEVSQYNRLIVSPASVQFDGGGWPKPGQGAPRLKAGLNNGLARQLRAARRRRVRLTVPRRYRLPDLQRITRWLVSPNNKPRAKLIVLDSNQNIVSKTGLFRAAWQAYPNIDYRPSAKVIGVDPSVKEVRTEFERVKYDVVNRPPGGRTI
jgi:hypothetical protein